MIDTPRYVLDFRKFRENCAEIMLPFEKEWGKNIVFGYSVKTNRDEKLIGYARSSLNWHVEVVSPDEYHYVKTLGIEDDRIILNGPCKAALFKQPDLVPKVINLDSCQEVSDFAGTFPGFDGLAGLRVNLNLESRCPGETTMGEEVSRFGIDIHSRDFEDCVDLLKKNHIMRIGLHLHTSTRTRSLSVFSELAQAANELKERAGIDFAFIDIGGGFWGGRKVAGKPSMPEYADVICNTLKKAFDSEKTLLILEPGASVLATCATYETRIISKKRIRGIDILMVDGSILHVNPFKVKRTHPFDVLAEDYQERNVLKKQIIGGATCMEDDRLGVLYDAKELQVGDILSYPFAGAYTMGLNSHFILDPPGVEYIEG